MWAAGIDIGTTTISAVVVDQETEQLERSYTQQNDSFLKTGYEWEKIQDPEKILLKVKKILDQMFEDYRDIVSIGITGQMHGIIYLDKKGKLLSPLYTWQDGRGERACFSGKSICDILREEFHLQISTGYGLVTHLYHCRMGMVPKETAWICTIMDYIGMKLTEGKVPRMHSSNGASLGLYDIKSHCFFKEVLRENGSETKILPEVTGELEKIGTYHGGSVCVAIGDNQASFLGAVEKQQESVLVNMGTGGQISLVTDKYLEIPGIELRPFLGDHYLAVGSSLCGGRAYALVKNFFQLYGNAMGVRDADHYRIMDKLLKEHDKTGEKLKVTTSFAGTREDAWKRGKIENIGVDNFTPAALIYGILDGMAEELRDNYCKMQQVLSAPKKILVASGNGLRKNRHLQKVMSEKFQMEITLAKYQEEAAYGAAKAGMLCIRKQRKEERS